MVQSSPQIHSIAPVVATDDVEKSIDYYTGVLGFVPDFRYGDPPVYAGVRSGEAEIYFSLDPALARMLKDTRFNPEIFIWVTDANSLFDFHVTKGAEIIEPVADRPWGARQYTIRDINGYHLKFAQPLNAERTD
jgi:uncharacterized glyoxalase superfamily protein PhnB